MKLILREPWVIGALIILMIGLIAPIHQGLMLLESWSVRSVEQTVSKVLPFSDMITWWGRQHQLVMQVEQLEQRVRQRDTQIVSLREQLASVDEMRVTSASTSAVKIPVTLLWGPLMKQVSAGAVEGVGVGDALLASGQYVGRVTQTRDHLSDVELVESGTALWGVVDQPTGERGILQLERGVPMITFLRLVPNLRVGDAIITAGDSTTDRGFLIGHIATLSTKLSDPVTRAVLEFGSDPLDSTLLFVVKKTYAK